MSERSDATDCPLCGQPNGCAMAVGKRHCWCFDVRVSPDVLARVPEEARGERCLCRTCATGARDPVALAALIASLHRHR